MELRLWDALDQQLRTLRGYYASADETNLEQVRWGQPQQEREDLGKLLGQTTLGRGGSFMRSNTMQTDAVRYVPSLSAWTSITLISCRTVYRDGLASDGRDQPDQPRGAVGCTSSSGVWRASGLCTCDLYNEGSIFQTPTPCCFCGLPKVRWCLRSNGRGLRLAPGKGKLPGAGFCGAHQGGFPASIACTRP